MDSFKVPWKFTLASNAWATTALILCVVAHILLGWLWCLIFLFRQFAVYTGKRIYKLGRPLSWLDTLFFENYEVEHGLSGTVVIVLDGDLSLSRAQQYAQEIMINARKDDSDPTSPWKYPEFRQYQTSYLGFRFWKNDPNFSIDNHVHEVTLKYSQGKHTVALNTFLEGLICKPYPKNTSPWDIHVIRHFPSEKGTSLNTLAIIRGQHSICDGLSAMNILKSGDRKRKVAPRVQPKTLANISSSRKGSYWKKASNFLQRFYSMQKRYMFNKHFWKWRRLSKDDGQRRKMILRSTKSFRLETLKKLANKNQVMLPAFMLSVVCHHLAKILKDSSAPYTYTLYCAPAPSHPTESSAGGLSNTLQLGLVKLPLGTHDDIVSKMRKVHDDIANLRVNFNLIVVGYLGFLLGSMFTSVSNYLRRGMALTPICVSNFAATKEVFVAGGLNCTSSYAFVGPSDGANEIMILFFGHANDIRVTFSFDDRFIDKKQASNLVSGVSDHFERIIAEYNSENE